MRWHLLRSQGAPFVYRVTLAPFPLVGLARQTWAETLVKLLEAPVPGDPPEWEVFAQCNALHIDGAKNSFSKRGGAWIPEMNLGIFADGPPPSLYTPEEIMSLGPGEWPRPMSHQLLRISQSGAVRLEALSIFAGSGALAACRPRNSLDQFSEILRETIEESTFDSFPLNVPLFACSTATNAGKHAQLDQALEHVSAAICEDYLHGEACVVLEQAVELIVPGIKVFV